MRAAALIDRQHYANGLAARHIGTSVDAYRLGGLRNPIVSTNRYLRLHAAFVSAQGGFGQANSYGDVEWHGIFDASYTAPGDYLVTESQTFFIAAQQPLQPVLCILTNRRITISRPSAQTSIGTNVYGGYDPVDNLALVENWPASLIGLDTRGAPTAKLPADQALLYTYVRLPPISGLTVIAGDMITDDLGRTLVVDASEQSHLGWRLTAHLVSA